MDVVETGADGVGRPLAIGRHSVGVHPVEPLNAKGTLDGSRLASSPGRESLERVLLPRGEMAEEVLGRPIAAADRGRALEVLVPELLNELADGLVFLFEGSKGMRSRRRRGRRPPPLSVFGCRTKPTAG